MPPRAGPLSVHSVASSCPVYGIGDVQTPRGLDPLSHHKLGLDVRVDFRLPNGVLEVEAQACGLAGATSTPTAAAVATASFAARGPVVRPPGVPPCLPAQALLLQQELEAFHFATCGAVLCLSKTVSYERRQTLLILRPILKGLEHQLLTARISKSTRKHGARSLSPPVTGACWESRQVCGLSKRCTGV